MYRGRRWTMRQYAGFSSAEESNRRYRLLLERGQTGLSVAFDLPTQLGLDSDDPRAFGEVGRVGVPISTLDDMRRLFDGIDQTAVTTSMTINAPASLLLLMYQIVAEERGADAAQARRHDPERHPQGVRRARHLHLPAAPLDAAGHRHLRLLRRAPAELEHDLDLRLPHPRGRLAPPRRRSPSRSPTRSPTSRRRSRPGWTSTTSRPRLSFFFAAHNQPLRGGGQVPRRAPDVGHDHARALRRHATRSR